MGTFTKEQHDVLWAQFVETYEKSQEAYDLSIRMLAAAGVAVTASLGVALGEFGSVGLAAAVAFVVSLVVNLLSYGTAQLDMRKRLDDIQAENDAGVLGNRWTTATTVLNVGAGLAFILGASLLAAFVASAS